MNLQKHTKNKAPGHAAKSRHYGMSVMQSAAKLKHPQPSRLAVAIRLALFGYGA